MEKKVCLKQNIDVMSIISSISNDVMINNLVGDLINRIEVTNFFCNGSGYCLKTSNDEWFSLLYDCDWFYIVNDIDGVNQQIIYESTCDGVSINITNRSKIKSHSNTLFRNVIFDRKYDYSGNLIYENKCVDINDLNNDPDENSYSICSKYFIDGLIVKVNSISYYYKPESNIVKYQIVDGDRQYFIDESEFSSRFDLDINKVMSKRLFKQNM